MDQDRFEAEVVALASEGTPLTVANVAARTRMAPRKAEAMLDQMVRGGHLESDVDENEGLIVYKVRGLTVGLGTTKARPRVRIDDARDPVMRAAGEVIVKQAATRAKGALLTKPAPGEKSVLYGALFGLLGPIGLAYAAPWTTVVVSTLVYALLWKIPLINTILGAFVAFVHLGTALVGGAYAFRFNQHGKRTPLLPPEQDTPRLRR
jgi:hypothetical protein